MVLQTTTRYVSEASSSLGSLWSSLSSCWQVRRLKVTEKLVWEDGFTLLELCVHHSPQFDLKKATIAIIFRGKVTVIYSFLSSVGNRIFKCGNSKPKVKKQNKTDLFAPPTGKGYKQRSSFTLLVSKRNSQTFNVKISPFLNVTFPCR